jgi:hypothetical protein
MALDTLVADLTVPIMNSDCSAALFLPHSGPCPRTSLSTSLVVRGSLLPCALNVPPAIWVRADVAIRVAH